MALSFLARDISDLCLGKPPLKALPVSATVADAISALKLSGENFISVWSCNHEKEHTEPDNEDSPASPCECVGRVCMADVICYLCSDDKNLSSPSDALKSPVSVLLSEVSGLVLHVLPSCSLVEAINLMVRGAQNLVVPIRTKPRSSSSSPFITAHKNGHEFCWITQEDIIRFLLGSIAAFSPLSSSSLHDLRLVSAALSVDYYSPAASAVAAIARASAAQTAVAVVHDCGSDDVDEGVVLIGEISPRALACHDEAVAAAVATLSAGDLMVYIDCGSRPPEELVRAVKTRLEEKGLMGMVQHLDESLNYSSASGSSSTSSDDESTAIKRSRSFSARMTKSAGIAVCGRKSSLVAVMIQAIAHRASHVWVVEEDCNFVGIVTFADILRVFRDHSKSMG